MTDEFVREKILSRINQRPQINYYCLLFGEKYSRTLWNKPQEKQQIISHCHNESMANVKKKKKEKNRPTSLAAASWRSIKLPTRYMMHGLTSLVFTPSFIFLFTFDEKNTFLFIVMCFLVVTHAWFHSFWRCFRSTQNQVGPSESESWTSSIANSYTNISSFELVHTHSAHLLNRQIMSMYGIQQHLNVHDSLIYTEIVSSVVSFRSHNSYTFGENNEDNLDGVFGWFREHQFQHH